MSNKTSSPPPETILGRGEDALLVGGRETGTLMRSIDWSKTAFGPVGEWPSSLLTVVNLMLNSSYPIGLMWGPQFRQLYNDAYVPWSVGRTPASWDVPLPR